MHRLQELASGKLITYVMTRLFDYSEKIKAEKVEECILRGLNHALNELSIAADPKARLTFVPFRDTTQSMIDSPNQIRLIYEQDLQRLNKLFAMMGFLDGLSKDEGICMEIGYAFGINAPIVIVVTDFIRRDFKPPWQGKVHLFDPVLEFMASKIIYHYAIPNTHDSFLGNLETGLHEVLAELEKTVYKVAISETQPNHSIAASEPEKYDIYLDFGGGLFEWERLLQNELKHVLEQKGLSVATSARYLVNRETLCLCVKELGYNDIQLMSQSKIIVTCADSLEMNSGTAAIQGLARALGKKVLLYDSKSTDIVGDNQYRSSRNLMIECSADRVVQSYYQIPDAISGLINS